MYNSRILGLLFTLFKSMSVIVTFAYILSRLNSVKHIFTDNFHHFTKKLDKKLATYSFF